MNISFTLNGKAVTANVEPEKRLVDIIRENFKLIRTKAGCYSGECGACSVLFDGELVCSCMLPAFAIRGGDVVTIEGFSRTHEHTEIVRAFAESEYRPCAYCSASRILAVEALLAKNAEPNRHEALVALSGISCQCADYTTLARAVEAAAAGRRSKRRSRRI